VYVKYFVVFLNGFTVTFRLCDNRNLNPLKNYHSPVCHGAHMYVIRDSVALHPRGCIDSVSKQAVPWHLITYNTSQNWAGVQANSDLD